MNSIQVDPYIIADIGSNWRRFDDDTKNFHCACEQIAMAADCGVNAVKFQLFTNKELYGYDIGETENKYALPRKWIPLLCLSAREAGVDFMCTAFSPEGIEEVEPFVRAHKLASSEIGHLEMLQRLGSSRKPVFISTGGATIKDLDLAFRSLVRVPEIIVMECVAAYPAFTRDYRLGWLTEVASRIGLSDHTLYNEAAVIAAGMGCQFFEKHFDAFPQLPASPDGPTSIYPPAMRSYVDAVTNARQMVCDKSKLPTESEKDMVNRHRRRLKITRSIKAGEKLTIGENFGIFRSLIEDPHGAPPIEWVLFEGKLAARDLYITDSLNKECIINHG